jgi:hypothetical protein
VAAPEESAKRPANVNNVVRARYPSSWRITPVGDGSSTRLEYVIHPDPGGFVPLRLMRFYMAENLEYVMDVAEYFQGLRDLELWEAEDGVATAYALMVMKKNKRAEARVRGVMERQKGLRAVGKKYEWFETLLVKILRNKLRPGGDNKAKLCNLSRVDATIIGRGLASSVASNLTAHSAVDEWVLRYPAMAELEGE